MKRVKLDREQKIWICLAIGIGLVTVVRLFYAITGDYFTFLDEYQTFDTAVGFFHTGKFKPWDFHQQSLSSQETYTRAWPHTILLSIWFRIFGINVVSGKVLSAIFGVVCVLSLFYITAKVYHNYYISILSCLLFIGNTSVVTVFRQIRMYSLWIPLCMWFLYFAFCALEHKNHFVCQNKTTDFIEKYLDFDVAAVLFAVIFLFFSFATHVNTLVSGVGILLFLGYCLVRKREKKYVVLCLLIGAIGILFGFSCYFMYRTGYRIPVLWNIYQPLSSGFIGILEEANIRYFYWVRDFAGNSSFMKISMVCLLFGLIKNLNKINESYEFTIYSCMIVASGLFCFLYILTRYYQDRYMIYIAPFIAIVMAWGIVETLSVFPKRIFILAGTAICIIFILVNIINELGNVYWNSKICYHRNVYERIKEDSDMEPVAIVGYDFRDYYGVQVFDDYVTAPFDRAHDMEILYEFAKEHPKGYVAVETAKINGITESMKVFMQNHSERIAGEGIDEWNIDVCRYHFLYPETEQKGMYDGTGWESGCVKYSFETGDGETAVRIAVDTSKMSPDAKILFLTFGIFTEAKESLPLCYQLVLPQDGTNGIVEYTAVIDKPCSAIELKDDCEVYYTDETYREMKLWEK